MTWSWATGSVLAAALLIQGCGRGSNILEVGYEDVEVLGPSTVAINGRSVHLAGVSTPSPAPAARCWAEALLAREAMEVLRGELRGVRDVELEPVSADTVRVLIHGRDLSAALIDQGLAARTESGWDWCGPLVLDTPLAPQLGYSPGSLGRDQALSPGGPDADAGPAG